MNIFLDTEFNGFGGELISLALVADNGLEFYEVLPCQQPCSWVRDHVIPVLQKEPLGLGIDHLGFAHARLTSKLGNYLRRVGPRFNVVADWPEDIGHFMWALNVDAGQVLRTGDFTTEVVFSLPATALTSKVPHNALEDARALKACYYEAYTERIAVIGSKHVAHISVSIEDFQALPAGAIAGCTVACSPNLPEGTFRVVLSFED